MSRASVEQDAKISADHLERMAYVYVRQSSPRQVQEHLESQRRQYELVEWALARGWPREAIQVIDEDQGKSSATAKTRPGFARLLAAVAGAQVGIVIALEVTRLARNSPDWHHLIYLCRFTATLIADEHTVYDPALSADRMVLGIRGQMGELELESSIARMVSARWHKAERGALLTIPPPGYDIDEAGELVLTSDEAVAHAISTVFAKFAELGSARQVFLWWRSQGLKYPVRRVELRTHPVVWLTPSYGMVLRTLHNPIYAGAYVFGKSETVRRLGGEDAQTIQVHRVKRSEWPVVIRDSPSGVYPLRAVPRESRADAQQCRDDQYRPRRIGWPRPRGAGRAAGAGEVRAVWSQDVPELRRAAPSPGPSIPVLARPRPARWNRLPTGGRQAHRPDGGGGVSRGHPAVRASGGARGQ